MLLPPALRARLAGAPGAAEPLPVQRDPAAGAAPFLFSPRPVRFPRDHQFFEDGDVQRHLFLQEVLTQVAEEPEKSRVPEFTCQVAGCCQVFAALEDYQHHYHMLHGNTCSFCSRAFPSGHLLDIHILEWHDSLFQILAQRQDMYQCLVEGCPEKFKTSQDRKDHMVKLHLYPADFRFDKPKTNRSSPAIPGAAIELSARPLRNDEEAMEVCSEPVMLTPAGVPTVTVDFRDYSGETFEQWEKMDKNSKLAKDGHMWPSTAFLQLPGPWPACLAGGSWWSLVTPGTELQRCSALGMMLHLERPSTCTLASEN